MFVCCALTSWPSKPWALEGPMLTMRGTVWTLSPSRWAHLISFWDICVRKVYFCSKIGTYQPSSSNHLWLQRRPAQWVFKILLWQENRRALESLYLSSVRGHWREFRGHRHSGEDFLTVLKKWSKVLSWFYFGIVAITKNPEIATKNKDTFISKCNPFFRIDPSVLCLQRRQHRVHAHVWHQGDAGGVQRAVGVSNKKKTSLLLSIFNVLFSTTCNQTGLGTSLACSTWLGWRGG